MEVRLEVLMVGRSGLRRSAGSWEEPRLEDWREPRLAELRGNSRLKLEDLMEAGSSHCWRRAGRNCWLDLQTEGDGSS